MKAESEKRSDRLIETVKGWKAAIEKVSSKANLFNDINGEKRMVVSGNGLQAYDEEGSGEYIEAVSINSNTAEGLEDEIFEIRVPW